MLIRHVDLTARESRDNGVLKNGSVSTLLGRNDMFGLSQNLSLVCYPSSMGSQASVQWTIGPISSLTVASVSGTIILKWRTFRWKLSFFWNRIARLRDLGDA